MMAGKVVFFIFLWIIFIGGCAKTDEVVDLGTRGFSPNGDGIHDLFVLPEVNPENSNYMVITDPYSRKTVLSTHQYQENWWNGKLNNTGDFVNAGLYNFKLTAEGSMTIVGLVMVSY